MSGGLMSELCECGCGSPAPLARQTDSRRGFVKGQPVRFIRGHNRKRIIGTPPEVRFWECVEKTETCWNWTGSTRKAYGRFHANGVTHAAHRYAFELTRGAIPDGLTIDHLCWNTLCVNPEHLEPVSAEENSRRAGVIIRTSACSRGHRMTEENTYRPPGAPSRRMCRACARGRQS